jgi:hypothetical protein
MVGLSAEDSEASSCDSCASRLQEQNSMFKSSENAFNMQVGIEAHVHMITW